MTHWTSQTLYSVLIGGAGFLVLLIPALTVQYRRYGRLSGRRLLGTAAACVYGVALIVFTLFPLPTIAEACGGPTGAKLQMVPFQFVADIAEETRGLSLPAAATSFAVLQVVLNVVLFVPLGLLLRRFAGRSLAVSVLIGFLVSLTIEATQYTGMWGIYPCGFRVADVDDLLANTAGALLGALVAPRLLGWMPQVRELTALAPPPVSAARRLQGMLLDWLLFAAARLCLEVALVLVHVLRAYPDPPPADAVGPLELAALTALAAVVVFYLPSLRGTGASLGQRLVGIAPVWDDARGTTLGRRLGRTTAVAGVYAAGQVLPPLLRAAGVPLLPGLVSFAAGVVVLLAVAWAFVGDHRGLSGAASGARMVDVRSLGRTAAPDTMATAGAAHGPRDRTRA